MFVGEVLIGERVALAPDDDDRWHLYFGPVRLATWNDDANKFEPPLPARTPTSPNGSTPSSILPLKGV